MSVGHLIGDSKGKGSTPLRPPTPRTSFSRSIVNRLDVGPEMVVRAQGNSICWCVYDDLAVT